MNATQPMVVHYVKDMARALPFTATSSDSRWSSNRPDGPRFDAADASWRSTSCLPGCPRAPSPTRAESPRGRSRRRREGSLGRRRRGQKHPGSRRRHTGAYRRHQRYGRQRLRTAPVRRRVISDVGRMNTAGLPRYDALDRGGSATSFPILNSRGARSGEFDASAGADCLFHHRKEVPS